MNTDMNTEVNAEHGNRERLVDSLRHVVGEAEELLKKAGNAGSEEFKLARQKFENQLKLARTELDRLGENAAHRAKQAARATDHAVHEHPYAAIGIGAALGFLLGMLISRR